MGNNTSLLQPCKDVVALLSYSMDSSPCFNTVIEALRNWAFGTRSSVVDIPIAEPESFIDYDVFLDDLIVVIQSNLKDDGAAAHPVSCSSL